MFWFIVLLLVVGAGFYFYQKMMTIEREIRAEQEEEKAQNLTVQAPEKKPESPATTAMDSASRVPSAIHGPSDSTAIKASILAEVSKRSGMKQTELYPLFADTSKKQLQQLLKEMADEGKLRREKQGSSYLLYPG